MLYLLIGKKLMSYTLLLCSSLIEYRVSTTRADENTVEI